MQITYQLSESEFTYDFFRSLKRTLKGKKKVELSVNVEESPYKMSKEAFEEKILASENLEEKYTFKGDEFGKFTEKILNGESVDLETYKNTQSL
jgi:hypothetical protein